MAMKSNNNDPQPTRGMETPDHAARVILRSALKGSLATLDRLSGHPYASLVTVATMPDASPVLLISKLALHTQNIGADSRASLLVDSSGSDASPLAGGRVTLIGRAERTDSTSARRRFLARHPESAMYADFPDFDFYTLNVERAHFVGGFGRIVPFDRRQILLGLSDVGTLAGAEADIVGHMNADHAATVELYATALAGAPGGPWRMTGIDPEGCDLVCSGDARRISFETPVTTPGSARQEFTRLAGVARVARPPGA